MQLQGAVIMQKTLFDCVQCAVFKICDRYNLEPGWKHKAGVDPCEVVRYDILGTIDIGEKELGFI